MRARRVARQHEPVGRDDDEAPRPSRPCSASALGEVVRQHEQDLHRPAQPLRARAAPRRARLLELLARAAGARRGCGAPSRGTARWRARADRRRALGERDELGDASEVAAVQHDVERERQPERLRPARATSSLCSNDVAPAIASEPLRVGVLHGELDAVEAGGREPREPLAVQRHAARDEVGVELAAPRASATSCLEIVGAAAARRR